MACQCLTAWRKLPVQGQSQPFFRGCALPPEEFSATREPWCYVQGDCAVPGVARVSSNPLETRKWKLCKPDPCQCMASWRKLPVNGVVQPTFHGCTLPPPGYSTTRVPWCYVEGHCPSARMSSNPLEGRMWRVCEDPCACQASWRYRDGKDYQGCALPPSSTETTPWCYVRDGYNCPTALGSSDPNEERKWRKCEPSTSRKLQPAPAPYQPPLPCQCLGAWSVLAGPTGIKQPTFYGCSVVPPGYSVEAAVPYATWPWCYVDSSCSNASVSSFPGETRKRKL